MADDAFAAATARLLAQDPEYRSLFLATRRDVPEALLAALAGNDHVAARAADAGSAAATPRVVAATPRAPRGYSAETSVAAGAAWIFRGDESRRRRGRRVDIPRRRVDAAAATSTNRTRRSRRSTSR